MTQRAMLFNRKKRNLRRIEDRMTSPEAKLASRLALLDKESDLLAGDDPKVIIILEEMEAIKKQLVEYQINPTYQIEQKKRGNRGKGKKTIAANKALQFSVTGLSYTTTILQNWSKK